MAEFDKSIADFDEAIRIHALAIEAEPDLDAKYLTQALIGRGMAWHAKGECDKAISELVEKAGLLRCGAVG